MARKIVVTIRKGGAGKTTTAVNLAAALQQLGKKTLLIDLDPQADSTLSVGLDPMILPLNVNHLFTTYDITPGQIITSTPFGLDLLPSHPELGETETGMLPSQIGILRNRIESLEESYDMIVIDTPHSEGFMPVVALTVANDVVIPLQTHYLAWQKVPKVLKQTEEVRQGLNPHIGINGILPVMVTHTNMSRGVLELAKTTYPELVYPFQVDWSVRHSDASLAGKPIVLSEPSHPGSLAYRRLAERFM